MSEKEETTTAQEGVVAKIQDYYDCDESQAHNFLNYMSFLAELGNKYYDQLSKMEPVNN